MISTRGRYAIRILLDLAEHSRGGEYIPLREVASRQRISLKYIEKIMPLLNKGNILDSSHGLRGGYRLSRSPEDVSIWEILSLAEGDLAPVSCLQANAAPCALSSECRTLPMWQKYYTMTVDYFKNISLADLMQVNPPGDYVI